MHINNGTSPVQFIQLYFDVWDLYCQRLCNSLLPANDKLYPHFLCQDLDSIVLLFHMHDFLKHHMSLLMQLVRCCVNLMLENMWQALKTTKPPHINQGNKVDTCTHIHMHQPAVINRHTKCVKIITSSWIRHLSNGHCAQFPPCGVVI